MGKSVFCRAGVVCLWVFLVFEASICRGSKVRIEVVGLGECIDCLKDNIKTSHAYKGLRVTIDCKSKNGDGFQRRGSGELDEEGKFRVSLLHEPADGGRLDEDCFAQLHSASAAPCPAVNGGESSKLVLMAETDEKQSFGLTKKLKFSPATCSSAFLWPFFKHPFPKKWPKQPFFGHPLLKNLGHSFPFPPKAFPKKPLPPFPFFKNPKPLPPIPLFKKPLPPAIPVYKKPLPQIQKPPLKKLFPPHIPIFKKPLPPFIPIYKPKPPIFKPPIILPPPLPFFKKPLPPFIPIYKPKPPIFKPPIILPPPFPFFKKPHLPFIPIYKPKHPFSKPVHTLPKIPPFFQKPQPYIPKVPDFHHKFEKFPPIPPFAPHLP